MTTLFASRVRINRIPQDHRAAIGAPSMKRLFKSIFFGLALFLLFQGVITILRITPSPIKNEDMRVADTLTYLAGVLYIVSSVVVFLCSNLAK